MQKTSDSKGLATGDKTLLKSGTHAGHWMPAAMSHGKEAAGKPSPSFH